MSLKNEALEKLRYYNLKKAGLRSAEAEYTRLGNEMAMLRAASGSERVSGEKSDKEDFLSSLIEKRDTLSAAIKNTREWIRIVDEALGALDAEDRLILTSLYVDHTKGSVDCLCETLFVEKSTIYRRKNRALSNFTIAMFGADE